VIKRSGSGSGGSGSGGLGRWEGTLNVELFAKSLARNAIGERLLGGAQRAQQRTILVLACGIGELPIGFDFVDGVQFIELVAYAVVFIQPVGAEEFKFVELGTEFVELLAGIEFVKLLAGIEFVEFLTGTEFVELVVGVELVELLARLVNFLKPVTVESLKLMAVADFIELVAVGGESLKVVAVAVAALAINSPVETGFTELVAVGGESLEVVAVAVAACAINPPVETSFIKPVALRGELLKEGVLALVSAVIFAGLGSVLQSLGLGGRGWSRGCGWGCGWGRTGDLGWGRGDSVSISRENSTQSWCGSVKNGGSGDENGRSMNHGELRF